MTARRARSSDVPQFGVASSPLSGEIRVGRLNAAGNAFRSHESATGLVMHAVADFVSDRLGGSAHIDLPDGRRLDIEVTTTPPPGPPAVTPGTLT